MSARAVRSRTYLVIGVVASLLVWLPAAFLLAHPGAFGLDFPTRGLLRTLAASVAMILILVFATLSFRNADEFNQQASKFAWYWGGAGGAAVSAPIYVFIATGGLRLLGLVKASAPTASVSAAAVGRAGVGGFVLGYDLMALSMLAGFVVARVWWTLAKR
jgi:hypothetical protein